MTYVGYLRLMSARSVTKLTVVLFERLPDGADCLLKYFPDHLLGSSTLSILVNIL